MQDHSRSLDLGEVKAIVRAYEVQCVRFSVLPQLQHGVCKYYKLVGLLVDAFTVPSWCTQILDVH